ncbi:hypothetical protein J0H58_03560 [bacterium]|nr:hypothetical protein [bacterium]
MHSWVAVTAAVLSTAAVAKLPRPPAPYFQFGQPQEIAKELDRNIHTSPGQSSVTLFCVPVVEGGGGGPPIPVTITVRAGRGSEDALRHIVPQLLGNAARKKQ